MSICPVVPDLCPTPGSSACLAANNNIVNNNAGPSGGNACSGLGRKLLPFCTKPVAPLALKRRNWNKARQEFFDTLMKEVGGSLPNDFCRICREAESTERLLAPCKCKGTMALVHVSCLQRWLREADTSSCELCGHQYHVVRTPRYGLLKSIYVWLRYHSSRDLLFDAIAFCAFTPLAILGTYLGIVAADIYDRAETAGRNDLSSFCTRMAALGVVSVMTIINFSYLTWFIIRAQHYTGKWYSWWRRHFAIAIILPPQVLEKDNAIKSQSAHCLSTNNENK